MSAIKYTQVCAPESGQSPTIATTEEYIDLPIRAKFPALVGMYGNLRCHVQHNHILIIDLKSGSKRRGDRPTRLVKIFPHFRFSTKL